MTYTPEQDLNHQIPIDPDHRYGCFNRPRQDEKWIDLSCGHSYKKTDPACSGCKWRQDP